MYVFRALVIIVFGIIGYIGSQSINLQPYMGAIFGALAGFLLIFIEIFLARKSTRDVVSFIFGVSLGMIIANITAFILIMFPPFQNIKQYVFIVANLVFACLFGAFSYYKRYEIKVLDLWVGEKLGGSLKVLDTSSIIDGRIKDIAETEFFEGEIIVPKFVIKELQKLSDSKDHIKRTRGRRGLEILEEMQDSSLIRVRLIDEDLKEDEEVDMALVRLAKRLEAKIITNDYNLNKIASLHGVKILNINELAMKLKPVFLPGEELNIKITKRGKEPGQGVGHLLDGTMVVIEDGANLLGQTVKVSVTSVLQTPAGRIIFTKIKEVKNDRKNRKDS